MKDAPPFPRIQRKIDEIANSIALGEPSPASTTIHRISESQALALDALIEATREADPASRATWLRNAIQLGVSEGNFDRLRSSLLTAGYVQAEGMGRNKRYTLTPHAP
jgi:hypothetical protein